MAKPCKALTESFTRQEVQQTQRPICRRKASGALHRVSREARHRGYKSRHLDHAVADYVSFAAAFLCPDYAASRSLRRSGFSPQTQAFVGTPFSAVPIGCCCFFIGATVCRNHVKRSLSRLHGRKYGKCKGYLPQKVPGALHRVSREARHRGYKSRHRGVASYISLAALSSCLRI